LDTENPRQDINSESFEPVWHASCGMLAAGDVYDKHGEQEAERKQNCVE